MDFGKLAKIHKTNAEYLDDYETPIYNNRRGGVRTVAIRLANGCGNCGKTEGQKR
jgi:hypothetical protein